MIAIAVTLGRDPAPVGFRLFPPHTRYAPEKSEESGGRAIAHQTEALVDLFAMDRHLGGGGDPEPHLFATDPQYGDLNGITDDYGFLFPPGEYKHSGEPPLPELDMMHEKKPLHMRNFGFFSMRLERTLSLSTSFIYCGIMINVCVSLHCCAGPIPHKRVRDNSGPSPRAYGDACRQ